MLREVEVMFGGLEPRTGYAHENNRKGKESKRKRQTGVYISNDRKQQESHQTAKQKDNDKQKILGKTQAEMSNRLSLSLPDTNF
jgi:hypothetical protein